MKKFIALLLAAVMVFAMAACAPAAEQDGGKTTYAIVCKDGSNPYMKRMVSGFEAACKELGVEFIEKSPATTSVEDQKEAERSYQKELAADREKEPEINPLQARV